MASMARNGGMTRMALYRSLAPAAQRYQQSMASGEKRVVSVAAASVMASKRLSLACLEIGGGVAYEMAA